MSNHRAAAAGHCPIHRQPAPAAQQPLLRPQSVSPRGTAHPLCLSLRRRRRWWRLQRRVAVAVFHNLGAEPGEQHAGAGTLVGGGGGAAPTNGIAAWQAAATAAAHGFAELAVAGPETKAAVRARSMPPPGSQRWVSVEQCCGSMTFWCVDPDPPDPRIQSLTNGSGSADPSSD